MEAPPTAALVVSAPEFLLEFLVVALDAPTQLRKIDQALERDLLGQGGKPILGGLILPFRPLDQKPFFRAWLAQPVIAMRRTYPQAREAGRASIGRALAPPDLSPCVLRQTQRERLDRGRLVLPIAADQLGRPAPAPTRPWAATGPCLVPIPTCWAGCPPHTTAPARSSPCASRCRFHTRRPSVRPRVGGRLQPPCGSDRTRSRAWSGKRFPQERPLCAGARDPRSSLLADRGDRQPAGWRRGWRARALLPPGSCPACRVDRSTAVPRRPSAGLSWDSSCRR